MEDGAGVERPAEGQLQLDLSRVLVLSVVSTGLYLLFWSYYTWKQLQRETGEPHFPVWHALTLFVPVYSIFRLHRHFAVINELAVKAGGSSLGPGAGVILVTLSNVLTWVSIGVSDVAAGLVLVAISTALITTAVYFAQDGLNQVWRRRSAATPARQGLHWAEIVLAAIGLLGWLGALLPAN